MSSSVKFNAVVFEEAIHQQFADQVKGYAFVIANEDDLQAKVSGGWAQAPGDGNVPMKTFIYNNIGSVSKVLSGMALLHLFDEHKLADVTVQEQLDIPIWPKLPPKWHNLIPNENKLVTYRHLLQHKSGIPDSDPPPDSQYEGLKIFYMMTKKVSSGDARVYSNFHFAILTYLIPAIAYPTDYSRCHNQFKGLEIFEYTKKMRQATGELFEKYMKEVIFPKSLENIHPSCNPQQELPDSSIAKIYDSKSDTKGWFYSEREKNGSCRGQGGYYMTAQDLANFARTFAFTNTYIGPTTRNSLYIPTTAEKDNRLVYSEIIPHEGFKQELNQLFWPWKCGEQDGARAALVQLPYEHFGVGFVNSKEKDCGDIARGIIDAFYDATRGNPIVLAKHGLPEAQYQKYVSELGDHGSFPDWLDFYNVGSEVYINVVWRPAQTNWLAQHDLNGTEYQQVYDEFIRNGPFKLKQVDSYLKDGQLRYAVVMVEGSGADMPAYHGISAEAHQQQFEELTGRGFVPVNISVTSIEGQRLYTAFYVKKNAEGLVVRSFLTAAQYQELVNTQTQGGGELAYLNTYNHNGEIHYSAIFYNNLNRPQILRHDMSSSAYQQEFEEWLNQGFDLKMITGAASGTTHCYAAVWQK